MILAGTDSSNADAGENVKKRRKQAFKLTPWRSRLRITSRTVLTAIVLLIIGGLYLAVNARVARSGRNVLILQSGRAELQRQIAELTATLAELTTPERMLERALTLGFRPAELGDIEYIVVAGYVPPDPFVAPTPPNSTTERDGGLSPAYTETLGDWISRLVSPGSNGRQ
ncbi:MAG: hypothetical protein V3V46_07590 [Anaerolineales bacterium]|jgi:hypothetical protein